MNTTKNFQYCYMDGWRICLLIHSNPTVLDLPYQKFDIIFPLRPLDLEAPFLAERCVSIYITYILVSKSTPWAAGESVITYWGTYSADFKSGISQIVSGNFDWFCQDFLPFPLVITAMQFLGNSKLTIYNRCYIASEGRRFINKPERIFQDHLKASKILIQPN